MRPIRGRLKSRCSVVNVVASEEPNDDGEQENTETTTPNVRCLIQQHHAREGGVSENPAKQEIARERMVGFFEPTTVIDTLSKVVYQGKTYEVDGPVWTVERDGLPHHLEVSLARTI